MRSACPAESHAPDQAAICRFVEEVWLSFGELKVFKRNARGGSKSGPAEQLAIPAMANADHLGINVRLITKRSAKASAADFHNHPLESPATKKHKMSALSVAQTLSAMRSADSITRSPGYPRACEPAEFATPARPNGRSVASRPASA